MLGHRDRIHLYRQTPRFLRCSANIARKGRRRAHRKCTQPESLCDLTVADDRICIFGTIAFEVVAVDRRQWRRTPLVGETAYLDSEANSIDGHARDDGRVWNAGC